MDKNIYFMLLTSWPLIRIIKLAFLRNDGLDWPVIVNGWPIWRSFYKLNIYIFTYILKKINEKLHFKCILKK